MKPLKEAIAESLVMWELLWSGPKVTAVTTSLWVKLMEHEGITSEEFEAASIEVCKRNTFWPKPHELIEEALAYREAVRAASLHLKALPYPNEAPSLGELPGTKQEVLALLPPGAAAMLRLVTGGEDTGT